MKKNVSEENPFTGMSGQTNGLHQSSSECLCKRLLLRI